MYLRIFNYKFHWKGQPNKKVIRFVKLQLTSVLTSGCLYRVIVANLLSTTSICMLINSSVHECEQTTNCRRLIALGSLVIKLTFTQETLPTIVCLIHKGRPKVGFLNRFADEIPKQNKNSTVCISMEKLQLVNLG